MKCGREWNKYTKTNNGRYGSSCLQFQHPRHGYKILSSRPARAIDWNPVSQKKTRACERARMHTHTQREKTKNEEKNELGIGRVRQHMTRDKGHMEKARRQSWPGSCVWVWTHLLTAQTQGLASLWMFLELYKLTLKSFRAGILISSPQGIAVHKGCTPWEYTM